MTECLRFLRLGIINILGITVPGVLLIMFLSVGFFFPLAILALPICQEWIGSDNGVTWEQVAAFWASNRTTLLFLAVIMAYIAGYIVRLSTPDDLDIISAGIVLQKMNDDSKEQNGQAAQRDRWPYQGELGDKFPYFHFKDYILSRGLKEKECADLVAWGPPDQADQSKRSKTHVNMMKLEVMTESPELSAIIESNEAHVRLMFGTWVAIMTCRALVVCGAVLGILGLVVIRLSGARTSPPYVTSLLLSAALLMAMQWAKTRIEHLFHYQRVREVFHIVACTHYARQQKNRSSDSMHATSP